MGKTGLGNRDGFSFFYLFKNLLNESVRSYVILRTTRKKLIPKLNCAQKLF